MLNGGPIGIAIIGAGRIGQIHAQNAAQHAHARVLYICDADRIQAERLATLVGGRPADLGTILESRDVEALLVCSPTDTHIEVVLAAAHAGKAVFCEKPIDLDAKRVEECLKAVDKAGIPMMLAFNRRFDPDIVELKRRLSCGEVGEIELIAITSKDPKPPPVEYVRRSGGFFRDMLIHDFDMVRFLLDDDPIEVFAVGAALVSPELTQISDVDTAAITLRTKKGQLVTITSSRRATYGYDQRIDVHGALGQLLLVNLPRNRIVSGSESGFLSAPALHSFAERYRDAYRIELDAFIEALKRGTSPTPSGWDGLKAQLLADAAAKSFQIGSPVKV
jgi:myo-inositol 2-dehydrogenase/D-chiro-inositol 1-dehydrogenase